MQVNSALMADPIAFHNTLQETINELRAEGFLDVEIDDALGTNLAEEGDQQEYYDGSQQQDQNDPYAKIAQLEQMITKLSSDFQGNQQAQQDAQDMKQLDDLMQNLHTEHGAFDDEFFLVQLQKGMTPEQAIEKWNNLVDGAVNSQTRRTPPILMGGAGNVPGGQVDPSKLSAEDRIKFMTAQLTAAQQR